MSNAKPLHLICLLAIRKAGNTCKDIFYNNSFDLCLNNIACCQRSLVFYAHVTILGIIASVFFILLVFSDKNIISRFSSIFPSYILIVIPSNTLHDIFM